MLSKKELKEATKKIINAKTERKAWEIYYEIFSKEEEEFLNIKKKYYEEYEIVEIPIYKEKNKKKREIEKIFYAKRELAEQERKAMEEKIEKVYSSVEQPAYKKYDTKTGNAETELVKIRETLQKALSTFSKEGKNNE